MGRSLNRVPVYRRAAAGLGFVPQEREIFPSLSVLENLEVGARPGPWTKERMFELFPNLKERLDNRGNQLSGGEQQMLSIARALLTNPTVLLMDEPTEGLAPVIVEALTAVLVRLRRRERPVDHPGRAEQPRRAGVLRPLRGDGQGPRRVRRRVRAHCATIRSGWRSSSASANKSRSATGCPLAAGRPGHPYSPWIGASP